MCGIVGEVNWEAPIQASVVETMARRLRHRGPDANGLLARGRAVLGHTRLSIIDTSEASNQPLADHTERFWIVYNGEVYNYRELRAELVASGSCFQTAGDTEVILEAYKRWGVGCLDRLNGMFAFALWDEVCERLLLARDRAGKKPLYYQPLPGGGLVFASELKALRLHPAVSNRINPTALGHFLSINYTLTSACIVEGVEQLPAAHYLLVERDRPTKPVRYWDLARYFREKPRHRSEAEAADKLGALIDDAVRLRLVSDVPLGAFLSGGIDSSAIVASMRRLRPPSEVQTFSIGFKEETYNELPEARAVAGLLGTDHHERVVDVDMAAALPRIVAAADEPFADTSAIPFYHLAEFARQRVTVALSGDGGDEVLAGYETYVADRMVQATGWLPNWASQAARWPVDWFWPVSFNNVSLDYKLRKFLRGQPLGPERAHYYWRVIFDDEAKRRLVRSEWREAVAQADPFADFQKYHAEVADSHFLDQSLYVDFKTWLVDDILVKVDRATMAHSLEARAPFLDHRLVEFAASLPPEWKLKGLRKKHLLKASQRHRLPRRIVERRKHGFNAPVSDWFSGGLMELARSVTSDGALGEWFDQREIDRLWLDHRGKREDNGLKLFGLTCLGLWLRQGR